MRIWITNGGRSAALAVTVVTLAFASGCGGEAEGENTLPVAKNPDQAAEQLEQAFQGADATTRRNVEITSEAMRNAEFEKAVVSLGTIQSGQGITMQQGVAIHHSRINLEKELIRAMERGDPNAARAYELLKRMSRN